jgi:hypothetical protein
MNINAICPTLRVTTWIIHKIGLNALFPLPQPRLATFSSSLPTLRDRGTKKCGAARLQSQNRNLKNKGFLDTVI